MEIVCCPGCGQPAEVVRRMHLCSTDGPIEHVSLRCLVGHVFLMPAAGVTPMCGGVPVEEPDGMTCIELRSLGGEAVNSLSSEPVRRRCRVPSRGDRLSQQPM
jgi:hypothetical protein